MSLPSMHQSANPYQFDTEERIKLTYENVMMLQRDCDLAPEEYDALLSFCAGGLVPQPSPFAAGPQQPRLRLLRAQAAVRELFHDKQHDIAELETTAISSTRRLKRALARKQHVDKDHPVWVACCIANSGEARLLERTRHEQCAVLSGILAALADEGLEEL
ncbi:hypothetical protein BC834DRAFT_165367 [Gloeopeniophorella convolvens]|nr:hypothetical protein BC834DRAFT_165367 [Gloeopeniophorella convolvens]